MVLKYIFKKTNGLTLLISLEWPDVTLDRIILEPNT